MVNLIEKISNFLKKKEEDRLKEIYYISFLKKKEKETFP
jgi:hypothetical protein